MLKDLETMEQQHQVSLPLVFLLFSQIYCRWPVYTISIAIPHHQYAEAAFLLVRFPSNYIHYPLQNPLL
jgi:hypothetical protein